MDWESLYYFVYWKLVSIELLRKFLEPLDVANVFWGSVIILPLIIGGSGFLIWKFREQLKKKKRFWGWGISSLVLAIWWGKFWGVVFLLLGIGLLIRKLTKKPPPIDKELGLSEKAGLLEQEGIKIGYKLEY
ncbi:MAG: hypothetical protein HQK96_09905, partial [Nitrospirae bacterium]|nr:hypothetical protein [Nitrospirota bacterium]